MNRRARQVLIDRLQIRLLAEDDVGGVFALVHAPVVSGGEVAIDRAAPPRELVKPGVNPFGFPSVGDALRFLPVSNMAEGVVSHSIVDAQPAQLACQPVMTCPGAKRHWSVLSWIRWAFGLRLWSADLETAGQPRRHPNVTQPQILVHEIK